MNNIKLLCLFTSMAVLISSVSGCASPESYTDTNQQTQSVVSASESALASESLFSNRDMEVGYDESTSTRITLNGSSAAVSGSGATANNNIVTITAEGTYIITGSLSDGQIVVDSGKTEKIQLVLSGAKITGASTAPIYVKQADKVFITLESGSNNELSVAGSFVAIDDNNIDAALFSKEDLTINGGGTLSISNPYGNGITSKDDLTITGGTFDIEASGHGLEGKDSLSIANGSFTITAGKDGMHSENSDDLTLGAINISGGTFNINSESDGLDGATAVMISGGSFTISSGDDGIHADNKVTIDGGEINILNSYEGIEGQSVDILNGTITLTASDDGLNAAGGNDKSALARPEQNGFNSTENAYINISGGKLTISAGGDGIDSNGSLTVSGGETYVNGPDSGGNGALDYDGSAGISGGIFVAVDKGGMAQNFKADSTQCSILVSAASAQSGEISLKDQSGNTIISFTPTKSYSSVLISSPKIEVGSTYTITLGGETKTVEMTSTIYGEGGGFGGGRGGGTRPSGGGRGMKPIEGADQSQLPISGTTPAAPSNGNTTV